MFSVIFYVHCCLKKKIKKEERDKEKKNQTIENLISRGRVHLTVINVTGRDV